MGRSDTGCTTAHVFYKNYAARATAVKIAIAMRYGRKKKNKIDISETGDIVTDLRRTALAEVEIRRALPATRDDKNPQSTTTLGRLVIPPPTPRN